MAKHAGQIFGTKRGHEQENAGASRTNVEEIWQPSDHTQPVSRQPKRKPNISHLPHTKSSSGENAEHGAAEQIRPSSVMQSPAGVTTRDNRSRTVAVSTQTSDSKPPGHLSDPTTSCFPQLRKHQTAKQNSDASLGASFLYGRGGTVLSSSCSCPCHKQPTKASRRNEAGENSIKMEQIRAVADNRFKRIPSGFRAGTRGKESEEEGGTFSQEMTRLRTTGHDDPPEEDDEDLQRLKSAIANRLPLDYYYYPTPGMGGRGIIFGRFLSFFLSFFVSNITCGFCRQSPSKQWNDSHFCDIVTDPLGFPKQLGISLYLLPVLRGRFGSNVHVTRFATTNILRV